MSSLYQYGLLAFFAVILTTGGCTSINQKSIESSQQEEVAEIARDDYQKGCSIKFPPTSAPEINRFKEALLHAQHRDKCTALWQPIVNSDLEEALARKDYQTAGYLSQEMLAICPETAGPEYHPGAYVAHLYEKLGLVHSTDMQFHCAIENYEKSKAIYQEWSTYDPYYFSENVVKKIAYLHYLQGDLWEAERQYNKLLQYSEERNGYKETDLLIQVAHVYRDLGLFTEAKQYLYDAKRLLIENNPNQSGNLVDVFNSLAEIYRKEGDYEKSKQLSYDALKILEQNQKDINRFNYEYDLGQTYIAIGRVDEGIDWLKRAQRQLKEKLATGVISGHLGNAYRLKNNYQKASQYYEDFESAMTGSLTENRQLGRVYFRHAEALWLLGKKQEAVDYLKRWQEIVSKQLSDGLEGGAAEHKITFLISRKLETDAMISFNQKLGNNSKDVTSLSFDVLLNTKGRVIDLQAKAMSNWRFIQSICSDELQSVSKDPGIVAIQLMLCRRANELLNKIASVRSQLSTTEWREPSSETLLISNLNSNNLEDDLNKLEKELDAFTLPEHLKPITLDKIQQAIPDDAALIEFVQYRLYNPEWKIPEEQWGKTQYAAYILRSEGAPKVVDLGAVESINATINKFREEIQGRSRATHEFSRDLYARVFKPIRQFLGDATVIFLAPDGQLNLIPFGALKDEDNNRFIIQDYLISYMSSGRELLRDSDNELISHAIKENSRYNPVVFANPEYEVNANPGRNVSSLPKQCSDDINLEVYRLTDKFDPLPCTEDEARAIKAIYNDSELYLRRDVTKQALFDIENPQILHLATHGFFDSESKLKQEETKMQIDITSSLLKSGIALAGANSSNKGEGIMTALEMSSLNLQGTKLAVLSACNSGLGDLYGREGVFGMRRALSIAGAETVVMSLWKVRDETTKDLMVSYYQALKSGNGRAEALRKAQCKMLSDPEHHHPYFWASFISSGEWGNLDGERRPVESIKCSI